MWNRFNGSVRGTFVRGDKASPKTRWYNHLFLALFGWKTVTIFSIPAEDAKRGYRVGYLPFDGEPMVESELNHESRFRMRIGHEACTFFAVDADGAEIPSRSSPGPRSMTPVIGKRPSTEEGGDGRELARRAASLQNDQRSEEQPTGAFRFTQAGFAP